MIFKNQRWKNLLFLTFIIFFLGLILIWNNLILFNKDYSNNYEIWEWEGNKNYKKNRNLNLKNGFLPSNWRKLNSVYTSASNSNWEVIVLTSILENNNIDNVSNFRKCVSSGGILNYYLWPLFKCNFNNVEFVQKPLDYWNMSTLSSESIKSGISDDKFNILENDVKTLQDIPSLTETDFIPIGVYQGLWIIIEMPISPLVEVCMLTEPVPPIGETGIVRGQTISVLFESKNTRTQGVEEGSVLPCALSVINKFFGNSKIRLRCWGVYRLLDPGDYSIHIRHPCVSWNKVQDIRYPNSNEKFIHGTEMIIPNSPFSLKIKNTNIETISEVELCSLKNNGGERPGRFRNIHSENRNTFCENDLNNDLCAIDIPENSILRSSISPVWQPVGCHLKYYSKSDLLECKKSKGISNVVLIGDSLLRGQSIEFSLWNSNISWEYLHSKWEWNSRNNQHWEALFDDYIRYFYKDPNVIFNNNNNCNSTSSTPENNHKCLENNEETFTFHYYQMNFLGGKNATKLGEWGKGEKEYLLEKHPLRSFWDNKSIGEIRKLNPDVIVINIGHWLMKGEDLFRSPSIYSNLVKDLLELIKIEFKNSILILQPTTATHTFQHYNYYLYPVIISEYNAIAEYWGRYYGYNIFSSVADISFASPSESQDGMHYHPIECRPGYLESISRLNVCPTTGDIYMPVSKCKCQNGTLYTHGCCIPPGSQNLYVSKSINNYFLNLICNKG